MISAILAHHPWLGPLVWQSTLCLAAGLGGSFLLRKHAVRAHQVLLLGLVAAVLIPALSQIVRQNQWGLLVAERAVATPERQSVAAPADFLISDPPVPTEPPDLPPLTGVLEAAPVPANTRSDWARAVLPAWLAISSVLLLRLAVQFLLGWRLARRSEVVDDVRLLRMIDDVKDKLGLWSEVRVRASARARSPVIWCWGRRPVLLVPPEARTDEGLDWPGILCHELAHAKRRDHVSGLLGELMVCALPWQPLLWWTRQRLAALSEEACDDWVIACGQHATGYARTLLGLIPQAQAALLPGVVTSRRGLAGRVRRILEDGCGNPRPGLRWTLAVVALAGGVSLSLAFAQTRPVSRAGTEAKPSAGSREQLNEILDAMLYHDRAVLPIALHTEIDLYNMDAPTDAQHNQTYVFEQRLDGKRLDSLMNVYRLRDGKLRHDQVNRRVFTGEQFVYRQQQMGDRSYPLIAVLEPKEEAARILGVDYMWGCTLLGHLPGDEIPVAALLKNAADVVLHDRRENVDGFACRVIEGKTDHGVYKLWIDPEHDFRIRRALIDKGPNDLRHGKPVSTAPPEGMQDRTLTSIHMEVSNVQLEKIGPHFIPTIESTTATYERITGKEDHTKIVVRRSRIDLDPDFEKLGAFVMDGIPEGTPLTDSDPNDHMYAYEWRNGRAVSVAPDGGTLVGRIQFSGHADLGTILIGKRSFYARFTPEGRGERDSHAVKLTPEQNGTFQVKEVPPGKYRLKLELTDLQVERTPSGGLMPLVKILAEAEREFAIPAGKDTAQKIVDLGVVEMALSSPAGSAAGADAGKAADAPRGQAEKTDPPVKPAAPPDEKPPVQEDQIHLRLVDPNGRPAAGARVGNFMFVLEFAPLVTQVRWQPDAKLSDENGQVTLDAESYFWQGAVNRVAVYALHEERKIGAVHEIVRGAPKETSPVVLRPVCRVRGACDSAGLAALGMPLRETFVDVLTSGDEPSLLYRGSNDPSHSFEFLLPPGPYTLRAFGSGHKEKDSSFAQAATEFRNLPITVPAGSLDLDVGVMDLRPTKWATMIGHPAPEIGPMKAWKNGSAVTLASLRGQAVWLRFADRGAAAFPDLPKLVELEEALGRKGLAVIMISNWNSLEEFDQTWSKMSAELSGGVREIPFHIAIDGDAAADRQGAGKRRIGATFERYGIMRHPKGQPTDILIDPVGNVLGQPTPSGAKEAISRMLAARLASQTASARVVRFPADRSVGTLYLREWDFPTDNYEPIINWQWLGEARGDVTVPAGNALRLDLREDAWQSGSPFATLRPDDIQMLNFSACKNVKDPILAEAAKLHGLKVLNLAATAITGEGLDYLKDIEGLRWLFLGSTYLDDEGAAHLADLSSLDYLNLRYTKITDAAMSHVAKIRGLKWLDLDATAVRDSGLAHLKDLTSLQGLSLPQCAITDTGLAHLAGLTEMRILYLMGTRVSDAGLVHLARMKNLRELRVGNTKVTGEGFVHLQTLKSLEYLELPVTDITDEHLARLGGLDRLKKLYVISDLLTEKGFQSLTGLKSLEELQTGGPGITDATATVLATFPALKTVWIQRAPGMTDEGLAQLAKGKSLTKLDLSQVNITGAGLAVLQGLPSLKELALADLFIGEGEFSALGQLGTLEQLDIGEPWSDIAFTDRDMAALAHLKNLKSLAIVSKRISDAGLRYLLGLSSLEYLWLASPGITDAGLTHLEGLRSLRTLSLTDTRVTAEGAKRLEKTIPGLQCRRG